MPDLEGGVPKLSVLPVLQALAEGVSIANAEGRIVFSNAAADRMLGTGRSNGLPEEWAEHYGVFVPNGDAPFPEREYPLVRALAGEEPHDVEMLIRNSSLPDDVTISATARPFREPDGAITGAVVIFRDVTALRRAQRALERTNHDLLETQRLKDELNAFVAHDLKNPLTTVMTLADLILGEGDLEADAVRSDVAEIRSAAQRMHAMVLDLLDVQLAEDGSLRLDRERVGARALAEQVCVTVRPRAPGAVVDEIADDLVMVADRGLLFRVLTNLVDNCVKYGPTGGCIALGAVRASSERVRFHVQDEGPGVPEALRESIFEKYAQVERSPEMISSDSRGLGLRFCRVVAEAHGGRIWVEDAEPTGARFCVELPVEPE